MDLRKAGQRLKSAIRAVTRRELTSSLNLRKIPGEDIYFYRKHIDNHVLPAPWKRRLSAFGSRGIVTIAELMADWLIGNYKRKWFVYSAIFLVVLVYVGLNMMLGHRSDIRISYDCMMLVPLLMILIPI